MAHGDKTGRSAVVVASRIINQVLLTHPFAITVTQKRTNVVLLSFHIRLAGRGLQEPCRWLEGPIRIPGNCSDVLDMLAEQLSTDRLDYDSGKAAVLRNTVPAARWKRLTWGGADGMGGQGHTTWARLSTMSIRTRSHLVSN